MPGEGVTVRQGRRNDVEGVASFTENTWDEFEHGDYIPDVFPKWVASDGPDQHTVVAEADEAVVGCSQVVCLSGHEAWTQGMRVHPEYRGRGVAGALDDACQARAREQGATVARNMVLWPQTIDKRYTSEVTGPTHLGRVDNDTDAFEGMTQGELRFSAVADALPSSVSTWRASRGVPSIDSSSG